MIEEALEWFMRGNGGSEPPDESTTEFLDYLTTQEISYSDSFAHKLDVFIKYMKGSNPYSLNVWDKRNEIWLTWGESEDIAKVNLKSPGDFILTKVGDASFGTDGIKSGGSTGYWRTGWIPGTHGGSLYTQNDASVTVYISQNKPESNFDFGARDATPDITALISRRTTDDKRWLMNEGTTITSGTGDTRGMGMYHIERTASNAMALYLDTVQIYSSTQASTGMPDVEFYLNSFNLNGAPSTFCTRPIGYFSIGSSLSANEKTVERNAFSLYRFTTAFTADTSTATGSALGTFTNASFRYYSSIDNISNLFAKVCYDNGLNNLPIYLLQSGFVEDAGDILQATMERVAAQGFFVLCCGLREGDTASGTRDAGARENYDIYNAVQYVRDVYKGRCHPQKISDVAYSGGAMGGFRRRLQFPDLFNEGVHFFGSGDYAYDNPNAWYYTNASFQAAIEDQVGAPGSFVNEYKARNVLLNNNISKSLVKMWIFHDDQDTSVDVSQSQNIVEALDAGGNSNYDYNETTTTDSPRWTHGLPNGAVDIVDAESLFQASLKAATPISVPMSGTRPIQGYLVTRFFEIWLGDNSDSTKDGQNRLGIVTYSITDTRLSFTVTPQADGSVNTKVTIKINGVEYFDVSMNNVPVRIEIDV